MAEEINATCAICGKGYHICLSCKDMMAATPWKKHTDTSEHYKIYQLIHGFSTGVYSKEEAKSKFEMVDLSDIDTLREDIKATINDIRNVDVVEKPKFKKKKPADIYVAEDAQAEEVVDEQLL